MTTRNFISVGQFPVPPSDVHEPADINNVYSKNDPVSSEPGTQGTVDTAQIAWDFMSQFSK